MWRPDAPRVGNDVLAVRQGCGMTSIEEKGLRVGDQAAYIVRSEGVIREVDNGRVMSFQPDGFTSVTTWELIERPRPEAKLGSVWVDPASKIEYVALRHGLFIESGGGGSVREPWSALDAEIVARLVPAEEQA